MYSILTITKLIVAGICLAACIKELIVIAKKAVGSDSFQAVNQLVFEELMAPIITLCPGPAWKSPGPFLSEEKFLENTFSWEEIFHPQTLTLLRNEALFEIRETYSSYYGMCFTFRKLTPEKVADYSFQVVVNESLDYIYYLHEPKENEYLFMSVYPYEVPLGYIDANNNDGIGGADIIFRKKIVKNLPGKGCQDITISEFAACFQKELGVLLQKASLKCKGKHIDTTTTSKSIIQTFHWPKS